MALTTAYNAISMANLQSQYGGSNPISMSEYRRGGSYVKSSKVVTTSATENYTKYEGPYYGASYTWSYSYQNNINVIWNGASIYYNLTDIYYNTRTSVVKNSVTYVRGDEQNQLYGSVNCAIRRYYAATRTVYTDTTVSLNTGVPSSGATGLAHFYGGTN